MAVALRHPDAALRELDRLDAEESLAEFIRQGWRYADTSDYVHGWHIDVMCEHLEAVTKGELRRLIITIPPRHMKSLTTSVFWPAWSWVRKPESRWLFASYAQSLSIRDSVKCRRLIDAPWYQANWGERFRLTTDQNTKTRFDNSRGGYRIATSVDGALTGEGGDIIVIDDPHNVREGESEAVRTATLGWWDEAMSTRLNDPKTGAYVIIMQRVHEADLIGHILERDHGWEHVCLPARYEPDHPHVWGGDPRGKDGELLWPERFGEPEIKALELALGSYGSAGQLQQRPAPREGGMFSPEWFRDKIADAGPGRGRAVRYWDLAATEVKAGSDPAWTAGVKMRLHDKQFFIEDVRRKRGTPQQVEQLLSRTAQEDGVNTAIWIEQEPGSSGKSLISHFQRNVLRGYSVHGNRETGSKEMRAEPLSSGCEAGMVYLVRGEWNRAFLDELCVFPMGKYKDQADAASGAYRMLNKGATRMIKLQGF